VDIGDAFLLDDRSIDPHLWIVISRPQDNPDEVVIVNLTSHDSPEKDDSCVLGPGDHPWIQHKTSVRYRDARIASESDLDDLVRRGWLIPQAAASDELITKILDGAEISPHLPGKHRRILENQGLLER
jgi:hypothetical protein